MPFFTCKNMEDRQDWYRIFCWGRAPVVKKYNEEKVSPNDGGGWALVAILSKSCSSQRGEGLYYQNVTEGAKSNNLIKTQLSEK